MANANGPTDGASAEREAWLRQFEQLTAQQKRAADTREAWLSTARLLIAVAGAAGVGFVYTSPLALGMTVLVSVAAFIFAVIRHSTAQSTRLLLDRLLKTIHETRTRLGGQVTLVRSLQRPADEPSLDQAQPSALDGGVAPSSDPRRFALTAQELDDLDLYRPPVGLFGLLNRTYTRLGAVRLRDALEHPFLDAQAIGERQASVRWLEENAESRLRLMASLAGLKVETRFLDKMVVAARDASPIGFGLRSRLVLSWSIVSGALVVFALSHAGQGPWMVLLAVLLAFNGSVYYFALRHFIRPALTRWIDTSTAIRAYADVAALAAVSLPDCTELARLRERFLAVRDILPRVGRVTGWSESGGMIHALLNLAIFYDVHAASAIQRVILPRRNDLLAGLGAVADAQMLCSLATFAWEQPHRCYPQPVGGRVLELVDGAHPLLPAARAVVNSLSLDARRRVMVVTGSNMSGKSTFLRMVATSVVLAQAGTVVTAARMRWSPLRLVTDLQARDNLADGESYFLAEVRQLRRMILPATDGTGTLGIMDEPLRGTNSHEQVAATLAVVEHLATTGHFFIIATHDQQVTELADEGSIFNAHFREDLGRDGLVFDYRLRDGAAQTRNALRVLEREGYPKDLIASANRWAARLDAQSPNEAFAPHGRGPAEAGS